MIGTRCLIHNFSDITNSAFVSPSVVERDWLLRRSEGLKRVRSLKLQLFCTLTGLEPSALISAPGERRSVTDVCLLLMLWPRGLAILTRSLKLSFWLRDKKTERYEEQGWECTWLKDLKMQWDVMVLPSCTKTLWHLIVFVSIFAIHTILSYHRPPEAIFPFKCVSWINMRFCLKKVQTFVCFCSGFSSKLHKGQEVLHITIFYAIFWTRQDFVL